MPFGRPDPPKMLEGPKMAWEAEILSGHVGLESHKAPWVFDEDGQARRWVEYFMYAHIGDEIPREMLAGHVSRGVVEKVNGKQQLRPTSLGIPLVFSADADGHLRWSDDARAAW